MESHFSKPSVVYFMNRSDFITPTQINVTKLRDELKGRSILVMVGAGFCGACKMAIPAFEQFARNTKAQVACCVIPIDGSPDQREIGRAVGGHCKRDSIPFFVVYNRNGQYMTNEQLRPSPAAFAKLMNGL